MCHGSEGGILTGLPEEPCLENTDVPLQGERIDLRQLTQETCFGLITDLGSLQKSVEWSHGSMVSLLDLASPEPFGPRRGVLPDPDLLEEGHGRLEDVGTLSKEGLQLLQVSKLTLGIESAVSQASVHQRPVLGLHVTVVVFVVGTGTGEANPMSIAEPSQFVVDEFTPIVRVQDQDRERQGGEDLGEGSEHKDLRTVGNCNNLCPSRTAVGDREGVTMISCCLPSIMTHQVYLHLSRSSSRELPGRDDGNESQQASWFCPGSMPPVLSPGLLLPQQSVHGGRPHPQKGGREKIRDHGPVSCHGSQEFRHGCLQSLATELPGKVVHPDKSLYHSKTIQVLPLSGPWRGPRGDQGHCSQDHPPCIRAEQVSCVGRTVPRGSTEFLQHDPFLLLPGTEVPQSNLFPNMLFLLH